MWREKKNGDQGESDVEGTKPMSMIIRWIGWNGSMDHSPSCVARFQNPNSLVHVGLYQFLFTFHLVMIYHLCLNGPAPLIYEFADFTDTASKNYLIQKAYMTSVLSPIIDSRNSEKFLPNNRKISRFSPKVLCGKPARLRPIKNGLYKDLIDAGDLDTCIEKSTLVSRSR